MPGVSRSDLRAIEDCPRDLQALAELQFRGAFWSQSNAKEWTVNALLTAKNGGLGADVAQDKATQDALKRALTAGVLLEHSLDDLRADKAIVIMFLDTGCPLVARYAPALKKLDAGSAAFGRAAREHFGRTGEW